MAEQKPKWPLGLRIEFWFASILAADAVLHGAWTAIDALFGKL